MRAKEGLMIMNGKKNLLRFFVLVFAFTAVLVGPLRAWSHCDGLDGPVVRAAQEALNTGNADLVLIWVQKTDEAEVTMAFQKALAVRKLNGEAQELADRYFFETLVRIHRAGEGAPYTGLKPAGRDLGPAIPAADRALERGSVEALLKLLTGISEDGLRGHFHAAISKKRFQPDDVQGGREYVEAYVSFVHYVEHLYEAARQRAEGHYPEAAEGGAHN